MILLQAGPNGAAGRSGRVTGRSGRPGAEDVDQADRHPALPLYCFAETNPTTVLSDPRLTLLVQIEHQFPYLDPLNHLQVKLMRRYRSRLEGDPANERLQRGIHLSINGVAAGLRNTG